VRSPRCAPQNNAAALTRAVPSRRLLHHGAITPRETGYLEATQMKCRLHIATYRQATVATAAFGVKEEPHPRGVLRLPPLHLHRHHLRPFRRLVGHQAAHGTVARTATAAHGAWWRRNAARDPVAEPGSPTAPVLRVQLLHRSLPLHRLPLHRLAQHLVVVPQPRLVGGPERWSAHTSGIALGWGATPRRSSRGIRPSTWPAPDIHP